MYGKDWKLGDKLDYGRLPQYKQSIGNTDILCAWPLLRESDMVGMFLHVFRFVINQNKFV